MAAEKWDRVFRALSDRYRRQLLVAMLEHNPQSDDNIDPLETLDPAERDTVRLQTELLHNHLPRLEAMEYVEWDRESGEISKGPEWDELAPLLHLIEDHREELPDGWL